MPHLFASLLFVIGSIFFLPVLSSYGSLGAKIFALGVFIFLILNFNNFYDALKNYDKDLPRFLTFLEISAILLYLIGELTYLLGIYFFIFEPINAFSAGLYFLVGSVLFTLAPIFNLLLPTKDYSHYKRMLIKSNDVCNIIAGLLFTAGSIPYLWTGFSLNLHNLMALEFIFGSIALSIGSVFSQINLN